MTVDRPLAVALVTSLGLTVALSVVFPAPVLVHYIFSLSAVSFLLCGLDKARAQRGGVRIPERVIWVLAALGGSPGVVLGMKLYRHKVRKERFKLVVVGVLLLQLVVVLFLFSGCGGSRKGVGPTAPEEATVRIAFGSCLKDPRSEIWDKILERHPDAFLFLGDNVYLNSKEWSSEEAITRKYHSVHSAPDLVRFRNLVPVFAVWDDHDYGPDNADSRFEHRLTALGAFRKQWSNPAPPEGLGDSVAFSMTVRGVRVVMTDGRSYRVNAGSSGSTFFGERQLQWVEEELANPGAAVVVLATGSQLLSSARGKGLESLTEYPAESDRVMNAIAASPARVVVVSGDRHYGEILSARLGEKELIEVTSSPLGAEVRNEIPEPEPNRVGAYRGGPNFGLVSITLPSTAITGHVYTAAGDEVLRYESRAPTR